MEATVSGQAVTSTAKGSGSASTAGGGIKGGRKGGPRGGGRKAGTRATATVRSGYGVGGLPESHSSGGEVHVSSKSKDTAGEANVPRNSAGEVSVPRNSASGTNVPTNSVGEPSVPMSSAGEVNVPRNLAGEANVPNATASAENGVATTRGRTTRGRRGAATRNKAGNVGPTLRSQPQPTNNRRPLRGRDQNTPPEEVYDSFYDDPGYDEKLQARNGCLGTLSGHGFEAKTNFLIDVHGLINSSSVYKLKGNKTVF